MGITWEEKHDGEEGMWVDARSLVCSSAAQSSVA
jgi:hypothetical protein